MNWKNTSIIFIILLLILTTSCSIFQKKNTPEYVSKQFLTNFQKLNFDEASKYGTENTKMMIAFFKNIIGMMPADKRDSLQIPKTNVDIKKCHIYGNTAKCVYIANDKLDTLDLLKVDGKWLVDLKKENKNSQN
jgi:regulatory protein YycI of two-component signal transduction system YycFG